MANCKSCAKADVCRYYEPKSTAACRHYAEQEMTNADSKLVHECCQNCDSEISMEWDVPKQGFKAFCPVCGKVLMLCTECLDVGYQCDYNMKSSTCRHFREVTKMIEPKEKISKGDAIRKMTDRQLAEHIDNIERVAYLTAAQGGAMKFGPSNIEFYTGLLGSPEGEDY
nr:MAG TPA: putative cytoplasmic protein [Caudoviricetes sp.]